MSDESETNKGGGCAKVFLWTVGVIVALSVFVTAFSDRSEAPRDESSGLADNNATTLATSDEGSAQEPPSSEPTSDWYQYERNDELRGTTDKFAVVTSQNSVRFDFPYCCESRLKITVRKTAQYGQDVIFQISDGQFVCGLYDCSGMISVDGKPEKLSLNTSADNDSKVLFAKYPAAIIKKLRGSEKVIIELPFYQEGNRQFKFDTYGLEWQY